MYDTLNTKKTVRNAVQHHMMVILVHLIKVLWLSFSSLWPLSDGNDKRGLKADTSTAVVL